MKIINYIKSDIRIGIAILVIFHAVGLVGIYVKGNEFIALTPFNLLLTLSVLLVYHEDYAKDFIRYLILIFAAGFAVELMGVRTGRIFGEYYYGSNLGFLLKGIPVIIGVNWLILCLATAHISNLFTENIYLKSALASAFMVFIDFFIEQLAPAFNFWFWKNDVIPLQNYLAWFIISFFFQFMIWNLKFEVKNKIAPYVYATQLVFFVVLFILNKFNLLLLN